MLLIHWRDIIEPVEIGQCLQISLVFDQLLRAAVEKPNVGIDAHHHLAIEFQDETQYAMGRGVLRPEINCEIAAAASAIRAPYQL